MCGFYEVVEHLDALLPFFWGLEVLKPLFVSLLVYFRLISVWGLPLQTFDFDVGWFFGFAPGVDGPFEVEAVPVGGAEA